MTKVLCFGGGNAITKVVLPELKKRGHDVTSVTSMVDSGGSTGQLRADFKILSPGDIRRHLIALSDAPRWKKDLFAFRFGREVFDGGHKGHSFGNVFLGGLQHVHGDYSKVLDIAHEFLEVKGRCLPATIEITDIVGLLDNGKEAVSEDEIDVPKNHSPDSKIVKAYLRPEVKAYPETLKAIEEAEMIIIGPGDMYSSMVPCILPKGIKEALQKSKAKKIFICPAMAKRGETHWYTVVGQAKELERYMGCEFDLVIYNTAKPSKERIEEHQKEEPLHIGIVPFDDVPKGGKFVGKDILTTEGMVVYDPEKVMAVVLGEGK
ncbi:MAG: YvcK family protein [Candidatus Aenigmarchaeota archaeon]|nr:YvcK family protein [Candidatus Aenigmarchaeota archaeon]